ncbi:MULTISPECIES: DUF885 domain-containing protein [unclassified Microbulbifer]|uniref:DUF885 domain-containing protein n=1 Tax=unclassified Microbulbifer TaxID=2619833 RepID=UPI0027E4A102|nr:MULTISPECIES: DUF885 domain-containing protein [unclassified Microbulbifer]
MYRLRLCLALLPLLFHSLSTAAPAMELQQIIDGWYEYELQNDPARAYSIGREVEDDRRLPDVSAAAQQQRLQKAQATIEKLRRLDSESLDKQQRISRDILEYELQNTIANLRFGAYQIPFTSDSGFLVGLAFLPRNLPFRNTTDYEYYLQTLEGIPAYIRQNIANMRDGLKRGFTMPATVLEGYEDSIRAHIVEDPRQSVYYTPLQKFPANVTAAVRERLQKRARKIIAEKVVPAHSTYEKFLLEEYKPGARKSIAATELPDGRDYYEQQVRYYTSLDIGPEEVHGIGLGEVARIRAEMQKIIDDLGFEGSFADFLQFLRTDSRFYAETTEELLKEAAYIAKRMDGKLPSLFGRLPRQPYTVEPVPDAIAPRYTGGRYVEAPIGSSRPGAYWVNTYALDKRPLYVLEALTFHEAVPGHHLQVALTQELEALPEFRRNLYISAFGEGWGLYSEYLGEEAGFYRDPYSRFGRLTYEMWRAVRLVVDTGMHSMGWSKERAIRMMEDNTALSKHEVRTEINRYISWPGQALSYKMGELTILHFRAKAEQALGENFDLREFHDRVLGNGAVPLRILEGEIDEYIAERSRALQARNQ